MIRDNNGNKLTPLAAAKMIFLSFGGMAEGMGLDECDGNSGVDTMHLTEREASEIHRHLVNVKWRVRKYLKV